MEKPTLTILNGAPGMGKSTLAKRYSDEHPMTLNLDIDHIWWMMGQWQESITESQPQKMALAYAMAATHLSAGYSVIIAQHLAKVEYYKAFAAIAARCGAYLCEILLDAPIHESVQRCKDRGIARGYETGFRPGGILEQGGGEQKLIAMHTEMTDVIARRPDTYVIRSLYGEPDHTYAQLLHTIQQAKRST